MNIYGEKMKIVVSTEGTHRWERTRQLAETIFCGEDAASIDQAMTEDVQILITDTLPTGGPNCSGLKWIQLESAGTNQLLEHPLLRQPIRLSNAAGLSSVHIAEFVAGQIIRHAKRFDFLSNMQKNSQWPWPDRVEMSGPCLRGKRLLVVGYGGVGRETARLMKSFGMKVTAVQKNADRRSYKGYTPYEGFGDPDGLLPDRIVATAELRSVLPESDVVLLCVPLNSSTNRLMNAEAFRAMKREAILINVSRGAVVDSAALIDALDADRLAHAYLDVFEQEPLPPAASLWHHPKVTVTPHMAGVMPDAEEKMEDLFLQNFQRFLDGKELQNELDRFAFISLSDVDVGKGASL